MKPRFFPTPAHFRKWLEKHHATENELVVGYYKKDSGKPSIDWPQSVAEALCFGWIDGIRRSRDEVSYTIRFTPRRRTSVWSTININLAEQLIKDGRMQPAGLAAFEARRENRSGIYSYEQRSEDLPEPYASRLKKNKAAFKFFEAQPNWYRKQVFWWIVSAKKEETRLLRLQKVIANLEAGRGPQRIGKKK